VPKGRGNQLPSVADSESERKRTRQEANLQHQHRGEKRLIDQWPKPEKPPPNRKTALCEVTAGNEQTERAKMPTAQ